MINVGQQLDRIDGRAMNAFGQVSAGPSHGHNRHEHNAEGQAPAPQSQSMGLDFLSAFIGGPLPQLGMMMNLVKDVADVVDTFNANKRERREAGGLEAFTNNGTYGALVQVTLNNLQNNVRPPAPLGYAAPGFGR